MRLQHWISSRHGSPILALLLVRWWVTILTAINAVVRNDLRSHKKTFRLASANHYWMTSTTFRLVGSTMTTRFCAIV